MAEVSSGEPGADGTGRILKNVAWLLGGKGFGAICSLIYLAILARSLGVKDFGHFSLIFATGLAIVDLAKFQSWQMVVKFGTPYVAKGDWESFGRLAMGGGVIDLVGALLGCTMAWIAIIYFGPTLELNPAYSNIAFLFVCALSFARVSAPLGILRTLDRYDLSVTAGAVTPIARLLAAIYIWLSGATVAKFLIAWAIIELFSAVLYWVVAKRVAPKAVRWSHLGSLNRMQADNRGILKFLGVTYVSTSLWAGIQQGPLLAVGYFLGTSAAGVYRIADQLAKGLGKLATLAAQALYPEVNRQRHASPHDQFGKLVRRINMTVVIASIALVGLAIGAGGHLLQLIGGGDFARGGPILVPLVLAASLELASVSYEPVLHAAGKAHYQLGARVFTLAAMTVSVLWFVSGGPIWTGWAVALGTFAGYILTSALVWREVRNLKPTSEAV